MTAIQETSWCEITETGVRFTGSPSFDQLHATFITWQKINRLSSWAIGDLLNYAETKYGETYSQLMDETGLSYGRLANLKYLSGAVPLSRRRESLSLSHHQAVAFLSDNPSEQERLLDAAEEKAMSRYEFREYVRDYKLALTGEGKPDQGEVGQVTEEPKTLYQIVASYFRAIRNGDEQEENRLFDLMYSIVEKEI